MRFEDNVTIVVQATETIGADIIRTIAVEPTIEGAWPWNRRRLDS